MGKNIKRNLCKDNLHFLKYINSLSRTRKNAFLKYGSNRKEIHSIIEIVINFLANNIKCKKSFILSLKKYNNYFNKIIKKNNSLKVKRNLLTSKTGGFIVQALLGIALPLLTKLFS